MALVPGSESSEPIEYLFPVSREVLADIRAFVGRLAEEAGFAERERDRIVLITHELSANAVEHGAADVVCVRWEDTDQGVWITVSDQGVFEVGTTSGDRGRGLRIVLALADEVTIRPGRRGEQGTTVRLRVPVRAGRAGAATARPAPPRVLLVDGDRFAGRSLSSFLDAEGYPTVVTGSAQAGRAAAASPPRVAIVDLMTSNGLTVQLCDDLMRAGVPVLALSILPPPRDLRSSRFLRKPVHPLEVLAAVRLLTEPSTVEAPHA
ncbi:ATP-binding protein [Actinomadura sp. ATCC 31491]|uniref:ATP-binding protein n=1 Tax=Actinomadura luzonensis TaxID=2805427 RepID=A0ABT0G161_9ACTN|nr:ATP-binding protein [Actinomadura luzonensis]MCK2218336.1 ATP-binding protein [Actinomadura luzonensis]